MSGTSSTFGVFTVARLGILAASQGLNVTGNNIANINTDNYVRQELDQFSLHVGNSDRLQSANLARAGSGVMPPSVFHTRDVYMDIRYRNACSNVGEMEAKVNGYDHLSTILDEVTKGEDGEGVLEGLYNDMITQLNSLAAEGAGKDSYDTLFRSSVSAFVHQLNKEANDLNDLEHTMEDAFNSDVDHLNTIIDEIRDLNTSIRKSNIYGDSALEAQDQRDGLLDELSKFVRVDITYEKEQISRGLEVDKLVVYTATEPRRLLIDGIFAANLDHRPEEGEDLGAVNAQGIPVAPRIFNDQRDAQVYADEMNEDVLGTLVSKSRENGIEYLSVLDPETNTRTNHKYSLHYDLGAVDSSGDPAEGSAVRTFSTQEEAQSLADSLNQSLEVIVDGESEEEAAEPAFSYEVVPAEDGLSYTVHKYDLHYDLGEVDLFQEAGTKYEAVVDEESNLKSVHKFDLHYDLGTVDAEGTPATDDTVVTFDNIEDANALADALNENASGVSYEVEGGDGAPYTIHKYDLHYDLGVIDTKGTIVADETPVYFDNEQDAKDWAEAMNKEYYGVDYRVESATVGRLCTVHKYDKNYDLNTTNLVDIHGNAKIVKQIDLGAVKNMDKGPITDTDGNTDETATYLTFESTKEANELAARLTNDANGETEYRVMTDDNSAIVIHAFGTTIYPSEEDARMALDDLDKDTSEHINSNGEATRYTYQVAESFEGSGQYIIQVIDIFRGKVELGDTELEGKILADREILTESGYFSTEMDLERDPDAAGKRGIPYYQHALDNLANHFANTINAANQFPDEVIYQTNERGEFLRNGGAEGETTTNPAEYILRSEYSDYNGGTLLSNHPNTNDESYITARNISISQNWDNGSFRVIRSREPGAPSTANDNLNYLYTLLTNDQVFYPNTEGPNSVYRVPASNDVFFRGSYQELLTDHISSSLASDMRTANTRLTNYNTDADQLYVNRDGVIGVDLNDEAMMIMKYQKAYAAACRLMTSYDEMLEKLVNGTAL